MVDLPQEHVLALVALFGRLLPDFDLYLYGSRATGQARRNSDVDLCVRGTRAVTAAEMEAVLDALSASDLPFLYDVVDWRALAPDFQRRIEADLILLRAVAAHGPKPVA